MIQVSGQISKQQLHVSGQITMIMIHYKHDYMPNCAWLLVSNIYLFIMAMFTYIYIIYI